MELNEFVDLKGKVKEHDVCLVSFNTIDNTPFVFRIQDIRLDCSNGCCKIITVYGSFFDINLETIKLIQYYKMDELGYLKKV